MSTKRHVPPGFGFRPKRPVDKAIVIINKAIAALQNSTVLHTAEVAETFSGAAISISVVSRLVSRAP